MRNMKKIVCLILALVLALALAAPAFAADYGTNDNSGTITVDNAVIGEDYSVYQILVLESFNASAGAYSYKVAEKWASFFEEGAEGLNYFTVDSQNYARWKVGVDDADAAEFALKALAFASTTGITPEQTKESVQESTLTFSGLNLGYYLLDSTTGALCSLDTTNRSATVSEKNEVPTMDKKIIGGTQDNVTDVHVGDTVTFELSSRVPNMTGFSEYDFIFVDSMTVGLSFKEIVSVTVGDITLPESGYTLTPDAATDGRSFEVAINNMVSFQEYAGQPVKLTYTATLNAAAVELAGEENEAYLRYSNDPNDRESHHETPHKTVRVYDFTLHVDKYSRVGDATEPTEGSTRLEGAIFVLRNEEGLYYKWADNKVEWVAGPAAEKPSVEEWTATVTPMTTDASGAATFSGIAAGQYDLIEIKAPNGYNLLPDPHPVEITAVYTEEGYLSEESNVNVGSGQPDIVTQIGNSAGVLLPHTGGIGTTIFYVVGGVLVAGAVILLVTKRRMNVEE